MPESSNAGSGLGKRCLSRMSVTNLRGKDLVSSTDSASTKSDHSGKISWSSSLITATSINIPKDSLGLNLLHSPVDPLVDFVFVHGLGGGSQKTWSKNNAATHYWPREWLPRDSAFEKVRIHSFGFDSDWMKSQDDCFNIHHFAKSLLGALSTSPCLHDAETPIVFIGHSMGGLVIKKAYLLACHDPVYEKLITRFRAIFFFATPHRGSDSAKVLHNILQIAYSSRAYVSDLKRGSRTLQSINEDFRNYSDKVELCSFYETQKLAIGPFGTLIVDPDSATLGYREEQQIPLHADHRSICKFETPTDPNYIVIRNLLASTVQRLCKTVLSSMEGAVHNQMKEIGAYLGICENLEDDLILVDDARMPGTCEWLQSKPSFKRWSDFNAASPSILWVNGKPATGKTVLAGYVVNRLRKQDVNCSVYFFKHGDKSKSQLGGCLRSLAFQMARVDSHVRETLLRMQKHDAKMGSNDERVLWRKLLISGIFQTPTQKPHFWAFDALDECTHITSFFETMLAKLDQRVPLRILITSRETPEIGKRFHALGNHAFCSESITIADTLLDIKRLVDSKAKALRFDYYDGRANLVAKILEKSQGSFLWTILVMNELSNAHSEQDILQVLDDLPKDMELLYQRTLDLMSQETRGKKLSKAILVWTTCVSRPLRTDELGGALELDLKDSFPKLRDSIMALCGQLVTVDKFDRVHIAHETVREFLLQDDLSSEFAISKIKAHTRIATVCLEYLNGEEMNPPRPNRRASARRKRSEFRTYACTYFSYHLSKVPPSETGVLVLVNKFLKSNILSWIEFIAQSKNLTPLIRTAKNLKTYLDSVAIEQSPLGGEMQTIRGWITDLVRIATKFAQPLITSSSSIYTLIPPFCPKTSTIYQTANSRQSLSVSGLSSDRWDDRLACVEFRQSQTTAVCYSEEFLAVGLASGTIAIYHAASCQEYRLLYHGEAVKHIQMKRSPELLAVGGLKSIRVWDIYSGQLLHEFASPQRTMSLMFDKSLLMAACTKNYIASWDLDNQAKRCPDRMWQLSDDASLPTQGTPCAISISIGHQMLAVAYSGRPVVIWDIQENAFYGDCGKKLESGETSIHMVTALVFNPNPAIDRLVVSYLDGDLVLIDPFQDQVLQSFRANCQTLATSADGRLLAGAVGFGTIQIYEFDTLTLLYRVQSSNYYIKQLAFSRDGLHLADVRGSQCNVWEPAVLLRGEIGDDSSDDTMTSVVETIAGDTKVKISAMVVHPSEEAVFCGKDDGSVCLYDLRFGAQPRTLYNHHSTVRIITMWPQSNIIMSVDTSNRIFAWRLKRCEKGWLLDTSLFQSRLNCGKAITQVLVSEAAEKFVLSTRETDHLWNINGCEEMARSYSDRPGIRKWLPHHQSSHMVCLDGATARTYTWDSWSEVASVDLDIDLAGQQMKNVIPYMAEQRRQLLIELSELDGPMTTSSLFTIDATVFDLNGKLSGTENSLDMNQLLEVCPGDQSTNVDRRITAVSHNKNPFLKNLIAHVIGLTSNNKVVFFDTHSWVCSLDLSVLGSSSVSYVRHFFVPFDWFSGARNIAASITLRDVVIARNSDVVTVHKGLEHVQSVDSFPEMVGSQ